MSDLAYDIGSAVCRISDEIVNFRPCLERQSIVVIGYSLLALAAAAGLGLLLRRMHAGA